MGLIILAVILFGLTHPMGALLIEKTDPMIFTFHYLALRVLWQLPLILVKPVATMRTIKSKAIIYLLLAGLIGTFLHWTEFSALQTGLPISHVTFITFLAPAWLLILEFLSEKGNQWHLIKCIIALVGGALIIFPQAQLNWSWNYLLPFASSILIASWVEVSRRARVAGIDATIYSFFYDLLALVGVAIALMGMQKLESALTLPPKLLGFAAFALIIGVLPNILIFISLKTQESLSASLMMSLEPVLSGLVSIILYDEAITLAFITGSTLIFFANMPNEILPFLFRRRRVNVSLK